ncbi:MAG: ABC transporter ATP-binding protein [Ardenticatenaceae bacterium]|nr:ABC transporter ATP-binding protein [Ardenticatenaceae bacterium]
MFNQSLSLMGHYLRPHLWRVLTLFLLLLGSIGLQLAAPQVIRHFLDLAQSGAALSLLLRAALLFLAITISQKILSLFSVYAGVDLGWATTNQLRSDLTSHVLRLDMGFHKLHPPGELIERIDGDVSNLADYFSDLVVNLLGNALLVLGVLLLLLREDWRAGLIGLLYAGAILGLLRALQAPVVTIWSDISRSFAGLYSFIEERLSGTEDIRANGGEAYAMARLLERLNQVRRLRVRGEMLGSITFSASFFLYTLALVATLALGAGSHLSGQMSIGTVVLLVLYMQNLESPLNTIRRQVASLQQGLASIGRLAELRQVQPTVQEPPTPAGLPPTAPAVQFQGVTFAYKDQPPANGRSAPPTVLHDLTFTLAPGRVLGILGRTGSGKTTLTRLLFRLYDVDQGHIRLDGVDIRQARLSDLRRHVGMVTQEVQLFAASLRDNLTLFQNYGRQPIPDAQMQQTLTQLGLGSWLQELPHGLDTQLTAGGQGLSAGQAQLLAFARVYLRNPRLVVLDEASSRLDPATEQLLEQAIDRLLVGRTAIIIAHRLGTVQRADDILILDNGRIVEFGERLALASNPQSRFYQLLQTGMEAMLA